MVDEGNESGEQESDSEEIEQVADPNFMYYGDMMAV